MKFVGQVAEPACLRATSWQLVLRQSQSIFILASALPLMVASPKISGCSDDFSR